MFVLTTGVESAGLTFPGLDATPGNAITWTGDEVYPITRYGRSFGALPVGTTALYVSFLMRSDDSFGWGGLHFGTYPFAMLVGVPAGMGSFGMMLSEGLGDISNAPLNPGQTYLVVVKISKNSPGVGITYRLYLDPTPGGAEPSFPLAQYGSGPVNNLPTALAIENGGNFRTDEIRVGTTWASVVPAESCASDLDGDGTVGAADLTLVLSGWGSAAPDLTGDGVVNAVDLAQLLATWGPCP
jgi:hypothetical protein